MRSIGEGKRIKGQIATIGGNPARQEALIAAGVRQARLLLVCDDDDGVNCMIVLTAKSLQLLDSLQIISRANDRETTAKLEQAGAHQVISPIMLGIEQAIHTVRRNMA